jgi:hypothetical protein
VIIVIVLIKRIITTILFRIDKLLKKPIVIAMLDYYKRT